MSEIEKRRTRRFSMSLSISLIDTNAGLHIQGVTRDVSSSGVALFSRAELAVGTTVTFGLQLPYEITSIEPVQVQCKGQVVRVEPLSDRRGFVMVVHIDRFTFGGVRENSSPYSKIHAVR
jgi:hypothetical protein